MVFIMKIKVVIAILLFVAPVLLAQKRPKISELDIPKDKKSKCCKMLDNAIESMDNEENMKALKELDEIIAYEPKFPWSYANKTIVLYRLDSLDECLKLCKDSYDTYGDNYISWYLTGKIYKGMKKFDDALICFVESYKKDPRAERIGLFERLLLLIELNRYKDALSEISIISNYAKVDAELLGMYAWVHFRANNLDSALYYADEGLSGKGSNSMAYCVLGEVSYAKGDLKKAIKYFARASDVNSNSFSEEAVYFYTNLTLSSLRLISGEYEDGIDELEKIKKFTVRRRIAIPYLYLRMCLEAMQNKNTDADLQRFKSLLAKDIKLEWDFSKTDAWLAKATLTQQQRTFIEGITKQFKEYVDVVTK